MSDNDKIQKILSLFTPHKDYAINNYYGVAYMKMKKNGHHQLKLIHDYKNGNMKLSSALDFDDFDLCMQTLVLLEKNSSKSDKETVDNEIGKLFNK